MIEHKKIENIDIFYRSFASLYTCIYLNCKENSVLIDCGDGSLQMIIENGFELPTYILISHEHYDHIGGLFSLLSYMKRTRRSCKVLYPHGALIITGIKSLFKKRYGNFYHDFMPLKKEKEIKFNDIKIIPHSAKHRSKYPLNSLCFEIEFYGKNIFYSGDTAYFNKLEEYIKDKDIAFIEEGFKHPDKELKKIHLSRKRAEYLGSLAKCHIKIHGEKL